MERLTYTVDELAQVMQIGRNVAYELCHRQGFPAIRIGKRYVIPIAGLHKWLEEQATGPTSFCRGRCW